MSSFNISDSVCMFCYRTHNNSSKSSMKLDSTLNFVKNLGRFLNYNGQMENEFLKLEQFNTSLVSIISVCAECMSLTNKFCEVYHQLKCLELDLEWKLDKLIKIIKLGGKVPSRVSKLNSVLQETFGNELENKADVRSFIQHFRHCIVKNGRNRLKKCLPRALIKMTPNTFTGQDELEVNSRNKNTNVFIPEIILETASSCIKYEYTTNVSVCSETSDDDGEFREAANHQEETFHFPNITFVDTSADQFENNDHFLHLVHDQIDVDNNESHKEPETQTEQSTSMAVGDTKMNISEEETVPPQEVVDVIPNHPIYTNSSSRSAKKNIDDIIISSSYSINLKTELEHTHRIPDNIIVNLNNQRLEDGTSDKEEQQQVVFVNKVDSKIDDTITNITGTSMQQRYNFRDHRKSKTKVRAETPSDLDDNDDNEYCENSSFTTSDSSSDNETTPLPTSSTTKRKRNLKIIKCERQKNFRCFLNACHAIFQDEKTYKNHKSLHSDGRFSCNFCETVETNLVKLSTHEYHKHLTNETKKEDLKHQISFGRRWTCPRCDQACNCLIAYQAHFACAHFGVGEEHEEDDLEVKGKKKTKSLPTQNRKSRKFVKNLKTFKCKTCKKTFNYLKNLLKHKRSYHKNKAEGLSKEEYITNTQNFNIVSDNKETFKTQLTKTKCNFCDLIFGNAHDLAVHETEHAVSTEITEGKKFKCPRCLFRYNLLGVYVKHHLKSHLNIRSSDLPGACTLCSGESVYILNSKPHYDRHHNLELLENSNEAVKCDECSAYFLKDYQLLVHKTKIHLGNDHKCEFCDKVYRTRKFLLSHKKTVHKYNDEDPTLPFGCDMDGCKKRYRTKYELDYHKRFHQTIEVSQQRGKRNATKCLKCGLVCKSKQALIQHKTSKHSSIAVCQECGKTFKNKHVLEVHLEYHKSPEEWKHECDECGKKCADKHKLDEHKRTHTKEKPFVCQFCGEKYAHRHNWRNHLKTKHGDEEGAQEDIVGKRAKSRNGSFISRKGSKKGDCIIAGKSIGHKN